MKIPARNTLSPESVAACDDYWERYRNAMTAQT